MVNPFSLHGLHQAHAERTDVLPRDVGVVAVEADVATLADGEAINPLLGTDSREQGSLLVPVLLGRPVQNGNLLCSPCGDARGNQGSSPLNLQGLDALAEHCNLRIDVDDRPLNWLNACHLVLDFWSGLSLGLDFIVINYDFSKKSVIERKKSTTK